MRICDDCGASEKDVEFLKTRSQCIKCNKAERQRNYVGRHRIQDNAYKRAYYAEHYAHPRPILSSEERREMKRTYHREYARKRRKKISG